MNVDVAVLTPAYKSELSGFENISISGSLNRMLESDLSFKHYFICPDSLATGWYEKFFPQSNHVHFPRHFFESRACYNQLCYFPGLYENFLDYEFMLILQTDAIVLAASRLKEWIVDIYDFVGAPETAKHNYEISSITPFQPLKGVLHALTFQGLNGGLSLRRTRKCFQVLQEYPELRDLFKHYGGGIGEDIFFGALSKITKKNFILPNEIKASSFALTDNFQLWLEFNKSALPFGFHAWERSNFAKKIVFENLGIQCDVKS
jgi:hypothetical protein